MYILLLCCVLLVNMLFMFRLKYTKRFKAKYITISLVAICSLAIIAYTVYDIIGSNEKVEQLNSYEKEWQSEMMAYKELHSFSKGNSQKIALIDSGISSFQSNQVEKMEVLIQEDNNYDTNGHGTIMCSLIKGIDSKVLGIAPDAKIYSYKVVNEAGKVDKSMVIQGIQQAIADDVDIISISLGSFKEDSNLRECINNAIKQNITVVASSGDYEATDMLFPASMDGVISVGALQEDGKVWNDTNAYESCDIIAPGVDVLSYNCNAECEFTTGTSQATALIAGYIALIKDFAKQKNIDLTNSQIQTFLQEINKNEISYSEVFLEIERLIN